MAEDFNVNMKVNLDEASIEQSATAISNRVNSGLGGGAAAGLPGQGQTGLGFIGTTGAVGFGSRLAGGAGKQAGLDDTNIVNKLQQIIELLKGGKGPPPPKPPVQPPPIQPPVQPPPIRPSGPQAPFPAFGRFSGHRKRLDTTGPVKLLPGPGMELFGGFPGSIQGARLAGKGLKAGGRVAKRLASGAKAGLLATFAFARHIPGLAAVLSVGGAGVGAFAAAKRFDPTTNVAAGQTSIAFQRFQQALGIKAGPISTGFLRRLTTMLNFGTKALGGDVAGIKMTGADAIDYLNSFPLSPVTTTPGGGTTPTFNPTPTGTIPSISEITSRRVLAVVEKESEDKKATIRENQRVAADRLRDSRRLEPEMSLLNQQLTNQIALRIF